MRFYLIILAFASYPLIADNNIELSPATPHPSSNAEAVSTRDEMERMVANVYDRSKSDEERAHSLLMYERAIGRKENANFAKKPQWLQNLIIFWRILNE